MELMRPFRALAILIPLASATVAAQVRPPSAGRGVIRGILTDRAGQPVTSGSVTVRRAQDTSFAGGAIPAANGHFIVEGLSPGRYQLRVRAIGFGVIDRHDLAITASAPSLDLGTLVLERVTVTLDRQVIAAERNDVILAPDRNIYSVKNMPAVAGGTAIDVLRATPGVEVDANDQVSLRGNPNVVVYLNGRPSPLRGEQLAQFLKQIPANTLDRLEVTTSPSAKVDPEGTAGIINIVLKQDIEVGLSAAINVAAGSTGMMNASGNVARQQGRWKWYVSPFLSRDARSNRQSLDRENLLAGPALVTSRTTGAIHPRGGGATVRTEYKLTDRDLLSLDASTYQSRFRNESQTDWVNADASGAPLGRFAQNTEFSTRASFSDAWLTWRRMTKDQQVPASMELRWNDSPNTLRILSASSIEQEDPSIADVEEGLLRQRTASSTPTVVWQGDWFRQFGTVVKLEGGAKATWRRTESDGGAWRQPSGQAEQPIEDRTIESRYREDFQAVYGVLSERAGKWTLQQGLRVENTDTRLSARSAAQGAAPVVAQHYLSPFPSAVASYAFSDTRSVRASYSRRISRPYAGSVTPLSYRMNQRTVTSGNPELRPEYTDALELTWQDAFRWGTVQVEPYLRRTNDAVRWLRRVNDAGVSITTPTNMARIDLSGVDVTLGLRRGGAQANLTGSLYHYRSRADTLPSIYSARASWWGVRANGSWRVQKATTLQLNSFYRPSRRVEAGTTRPLGYLNGGIRRTFAEGKGSVNLSITDPFNWQQFRSTFTDGRVSDFTVFRTESRTVSLSVSRSFGQQVRIRGRAGQDDATTAPPPTP